jgi:integrase
MKLTALTVENLRPTDSRREIPDALLPGLYLIVQPSGKKSWAIRYRHHGQTRKHTLGSFPAIDLKAARGIGAEALRVVAENRDPAREKKRARADTIDALIVRFLDEYQGNGNRPRTIAETKRHLGDLLNRWRRRPTRDITKDDVLALLRDITKAGKPITANRVLASVRRMFNWAVSQNLLTTSPCAGVERPNKEIPRDRVLTDAELSRVWNAARRAGFPFGPLVQLLILTGARRDEVGAMRWSEVNLRAKLWSLPAARTKNGRDHDVPLSEQAVAILKALPRIDESDFVLTTTGKSPISGYSKSKKHIDKLAGIAPWRLHDLRRTVATNLQKLGVRLEVTEAVLNHVSGSRAGVTGIYARHDYANEKRAALKKWGDRVARLS